MHSATLLAAALPLLAAASPLDRRAGGPMGVAIPKNCTTLNPLPHARCGTANVHGWQVSESFTNRSSLYYSYYDSVGSAASVADFCFEQCYGYGTKGSCKAAVSAHNVTVPAGYYGGKGGYLATACLMYSDYLTPNDFVKAPKGQWVNATAIDIYCPSS